MALINDQMLAAKVKTQIAVNGLKDKGEIKVEAKDGVVTLSGKVDSEKNVEAVRRAALSVSETIGVTNLLKTQ